MLTVNSVVSTLCLDIINVLLIDYMFSSFFKRKHNRWLYCLGVVVVYVVVHVKWFAGYSVLMLDAMVILSVSFNYFMTIKERVCFALLGIVLIAMMDFMIYQLVINVFHCNVLIKGDYHNDSLTIFRTVISRYFLYLLLYFFMYRKKLVDDVKVRMFKYISLGVSVFYGLAIVVFFNELLFYHHTVGKIFVFTLILYNAVLVGFDYYESMHLKTVHEFDAMKRNRSFQERYWKDYVDSYEWIRKTKHDMKNSYLVLYEFILENRYMELKESIESKIKNINEMDKLVYFGNPMVDAVLCKKRADALEKGIDIKYKMGIVSTGNIDCEDLGILIANALDNAIEATVNSGYDVIDVEMFTNMGYLCIKVINYVDDVDKVRFDKTSKLDKNNHGIGIRSMKECAKKYNGYLDLDKDGNRVVLRVNLYLG